MQLSTERFKQAMEDNINEIAETDEPDDGPSDPLDNAKPIDVDEIESLDLDHDSVLEEAIEFLTKPALPTKIAA